MSKVIGSNAWADELASLIENRGIKYTDESIGISTPAFQIKKSEIMVSELREGELAESESLKDQAKGFAESWGELILELGKGCRDAVQQNFVTEDSYVVQKLRGPMAKVSLKLRCLNECLPEDRNPVHAWPVIFFVFLLAFAALNVNTKHGSSVTLVKKVKIHPPSAILILLPDGRHMAYHELGVSGDRARFSLIVPHGFLSSRLAGIPGVKELLLEEFGVRLVTYDLPGFGESDPHPNRNFNSSALDMLYLANAIGINKFWVLGYSSGAMHAWAALRYIPKHIAGAAMVAPMVNPYESSMTKEEKSRTWGKWVRRRKLMYYLAWKFPKFLAYFYRRSFLSGQLDQIDKWLSLSLGKRDKALIEKPRFEEFWHRDVEESVRQRNAKPFIEEAVLQVSNWGFSMSDLQMQKKCPGKGILPWLKFMYSQAECELTGFLGPIHIWQGMDDKVVPPSMTDYVARVLSTAIVHKQPDEGHFSYFHFCDECHRQIFSALFGGPQGPLDNTEKTQSEGDVKELLPNTDSANE